MDFHRKYHKGEIQAQKLAGERKQADFNGQVISNSIIEGALTFISDQEYIVASASDNSSNIWTSVLSGDKGFIVARTPRLLVINQKKLDFVKHNPVIKQLNKGSSIGLLAIELASRRRIRINGKITSITNEEIEIKVKQAYPNCMKYIQRRHIINRELWNQLDNQESGGEKIGETEKKLILSADTFFIGSAHPNGNLDASHRGGNPGFIELINNDIIRIPDYKGNSMFNTFGNLLLNNRAGIVFWDFEHNQLLHLAGRAQITWDSSDKSISNTGRFWEFTIEQWNQMPIGRNFTWEFLDYSPHNN